MAPKLPIYTKLSEEDLSDAPKGAWLDAIKTPVNDNLKATKDLLSGQLTFQQNISSEVKELTIDVPDPWVPVTSFSNSYTDFGNPFPPVAYMKHPDGSVEIRGCVDNGVGVSKIFNLPSPYRPFKYMSFSEMNAGSGNNGITIQTGGDVYELGVLGQVCLNCRYLAADATPIPNIKFPLTFATKFTKKPLCVIVAYVEDVSTSEVKSLGSIGLIDWDFVTVAGKPNIKIKNICGLPYNRKYKIKFLVVGE